MIPIDYEERVYAGVLGKMIGVYLGRPFEGWIYERIIQELGEIEYYVHERLNKPLVVTDDDLAGTFTFLRALPDYGYRRDLTSAEIGQTWLNTLIEGRSVLWWGGLGNSTEHTAFIRLKNGTPAPQSGSATLNGKIVSEQIGAQIFIDGWGMVSPGDPELAADLAGRAARVSHDGEAVYGAQVIAALEAQAFVESDLARLIEVAVSLIPREAVIFRLIEELREQHEKENDWHKTRSWLATHYGYDRFIGNCHIVPNHGLVILSLLYGENDFQKSLKIVNTAGWDTDCNSGNVGCLMGIKNGLGAIDQGPDWRGPVGDRLFLSQAEGGQAITDAVQVAYFIANCGRALSGEPPVTPKKGARFHFEAPGSVQGFRADLSPATGGSLKLVNVAGHSQAGGRSLALRYSRLSAGEKVRAATPTFILPEELDMPGYTLLASPTLYPGQIVQAGLYADPQNSQPTGCRCYCQSYTARDALQTTYGTEIVLRPGEARRLEWQVESPMLAPIALIGFEIGPQKAGDGVIYLDYLTWTGAPKLDFGRPSLDGTVWRRAWVDAVDQFITHMPESFRLVQNQGTGLLIQGTRDWTDYRVSAVVTSCLASSLGIAARVQGLRQSYQLIIDSGGRIRLVKMLADEITLGESEFSWKFGQAVELALQVNGSRLQAWVDRQPIFDLIDEEPRLASGGVALVVCNGCLSCDLVSVRPVD